MNGAASRPDKEIKVGAVRVAIWSNARHTSDGKPYTTHRVIVERIYRNSQSEFKWTSSLETNDIPKAILGLKKAYEFITMTNKETTNTNIEFSGSHSEVRMP